jgi:hypothetical protein
MVAFSKPNASNGFNDRCWQYAVDRREAGDSLRTIAAALGVTHNTVVYNLSQPPPSERVAAPRPPSNNVYTIQSRRDFVKSLARERFVDARGTTRPRYPSASMIANVINTSGRGFPSVSASTVRRDLRAIGFRSRKRQRGPRRVDGDEEKRLSAARKLLRKGKSYLERIIFTDEKYFDSGDHGEWVEDGQTPSRITRDTWCPRVHVWGAIGKNFRFLVFLKTGRQTADSYKRCCLIPLAAKLKEDDVLDCMMVIAHMVRHL